MKCPTCEGKKTIGPAYACGPSGCTYIENTGCITCKGDGEITEEHAERIAYGRKLRKERIARKQTIGQRAQELGLSPATLSGLENGRISLDGVKTHDLLSALQAAQYANPALQRRQP